MMTTNPKIAVVGNCQARPLGAIIKAMIPDVEILNPVIVHLAKLNDEDRVLEDLSNADYILSQLVMENYHIPFVQTQFLKSTFGERVVPWLNLYYRGQNPEIVYYRDFPKTNTDFPLGEYHIATIYESHRIGLSAQQTVDKLRDPDWNNERYMSVASESIEELARREKIIPAKIVEYIVSREQDQRLFFTFNHPTLQLLAEYAYQILRVMDIRPEYKIEAGMLPEPLNKFVVPANPMNTKLASDVRTYRGLTKRQNSEGNFSLYTDEEICDIYFDFYEKMSGRSV